MSSDLQWLLLRNYNSFVVKRVPEGPVFSREPGNLRNLHSYKYSGLANEKTIDISETSEGTIQITTRKTKVAPTAVRPAFAKSTIRPRSGPRRAQGIVAQYARRGYRADLRPAAVARVSAILRTKKPRRPTPPKKVRGRKAKELAAASE
ncbi:putative ribosomal protein [Lyophyllum shimeji]|uniref:Ribosomal protein n=1 Tax=Lyophyllum shimeji TaxID=47721 RepID=A0A9P3PVG2_LYOSH|nr:putative ribosomal protein [Lyophyllum shimeji]